MMHAKTKIGGCVRLFKIDTNTYSYLQCLSVKYKINPETKSKNESNALVMIESDPDCTEAKIFTANNRAFMAICNAKVSCFSVL